MIEIKELERTGGGTVIRVITNSISYNTNERGTSIWIKDSDSDEIIIPQGQYILRRPGCEIKIPDADLPSSTVNLDIMISSTTLGTVRARKTSGVWRYFTFTVESSDNYPIQ